MAKITTGAVEAMEKKKRRLDTNQLAKLIVGVATVEPFQKVRRSKSKRKRRKPRKRR